MTYDELVSRQHWAETALFRLLSRELPTSHMIDVGAHHGIMAGPFLDAGWRVDAFEPIEANRHVLHERCGQHDKLRVWPAAVSDRCGTRPFHLALNLDGSLHEYHHSLERTEEDSWHRKGPVVNVDVLTLDSLVARGDLPRRVGMLKVDTEGHDLAVLRGAVELECEAICVEYWGDGLDLGPSPSPVDKLVEHLGRHGYGSYLVIDHGQQSTSVHYCSLAPLTPTSWGNVIAFHSSVAGLFARLPHHPEWLFVLEMCREGDRLSRETREKEAVIQRLSREGDAKENIIRILNNVAAERLAIIERFEKQPLRSLLAKFGRLFRRRSA